MLNDYWIKKGYWWLNLVGAFSNEYVEGAVKHYQEKLGFKGKEIDGMAGTNTIIRTEEYQATHGLKKDGICGALTQLSLDTQDSYSWDNVKHFKKSEFACQDYCGLDNIDINLVKILEDIRSHFGDNPIIITSGCRCKKHNAEVGGVEGSYHTPQADGKCKASDFYIQNVNTRDVLNYCQELVNKGILRYTYTNNSNMSGAVHIDIGGK